MVTNSFGPMDGCLVKELSKFSTATNSQIKKTIKSESYELEITKSLLNLLYNIVKVGSVPVATTQKEYLDSHSDIVLQLLDKRVGLQKKKLLLEENIPLARNISATCHTVAGL